MIILRITRMPIDIQTAQAVIIMRPIGSVHRSSMYFGLVIPDEAHHRSGNTPMIDAEALASIDMA